MTKAGQSTSARLRILVRRSRETNDHEVRLFGDDVDLLPRFGQQDSLGLDPDDILLSPCRLIPSEGSFDTVVGRCSCGCVGCGDVVVGIAADQGHILWNARGLEGCFEADQYHTEVARALSDHSWETPERAAGRLVRERIDRERLALHGMTFSWASGRAAANQFVVALNLEPGPFQVLVSFPTGACLEPDALSHRIVQALSAHPDQWASVQWLPQQSGLLVPGIAGPGWHPWADPNQA